MSLSYSSTSLASGAENYEWPSSVYTVTTRLVQDSAISQEIFLKAATVSDAQCAWKTSMSSSSHFHPPFSSQVSVLASLPSPLLTDCSLSPFISSTEIQTAFPGMRAANLNRKLRPSRTQRILEQASSSMLRASRTRSFGNSLSVAISTYDLWKQHEMVETRRRLRSRQLVIIRDKQRHLELAALRSMSQTSCSSPPVENALGLTSAPRVLQDLGEQDKAQTAYSPSSSSSEREFKSTVSSSKPLTHALFSNPFACPTRSSLKRSSFTHMYDTVVEESTRARSLSLLELQAQQMEREAEMQRVKERAEIEVRAMRINQKIAQKQTTPLSKLLAFFRCFGQQDLANQFDREIERYRRASDEETIFPDVLNS